MKLNFNMQNTKNEFIKRLSEVNIYFETIELLDKGSCKFVCMDINGIIIEKYIDPNLSKILKANGFLLLYNLIEATIRNSINAIINSVHAENMTFRMLSERLRILWLNQEIRGLKDNSFNVKILREKMTDISTKILSDELLIFKNECVNISGNIDAQEIRNIAKQFGYSESRNGSGLLTIKEKRNKLAHGEFTFADVGQDYSVGDLLRFKQETEAYLNDVLSQIESYINNKVFNI